MRRTKVDSIRDTIPLNQFLPMAGLIVLMFVSLTTVSACGGGGTGGSKWEGAVTLVPEGARAVDVFDVSAIIAGDSPAVIPRELEDLTWVGFLIENVSSFVTASLELGGGSYSGELNIAEGDFDFGRIRESLSGYSTEEHGGYEIFDTGGGFYTLLEGEDSVVKGSSVDATKAVLDAVGKGSGFLLHGEEPRTVQYGTHFGVAADEYVGMTLNRAHGGFFTHVDGSAPGAFRGAGWGSGWSASAGSGSTVNVRVFLSFQTEEAAKSIEDDVKAWFQTGLDERVRLESVERDGLYIIGTATLDEEDWYEDWTRPFIRARFY